MQDIELYDLYDVWYQPWWQTQAAKIGFVVAGLILLSVLVWFIVRRFLRAPSVPFWQISLKQCAQLKRESNSLEMSFLYAQLTTLLKEYLEKRYLGQFKSLTDQELVEHVAKSGLSDEQKSILKKLLVYAQPVKFDVQSGQLEDPAIHIALLERFIRETHPVD